MLLASRRFVIASLAAASIGLVACSTPPSVPAGAREALAPTGVLRIAVYPGSPTSLVENAPEAQMRGVSVDLGRSLAAKLGVPSRVVVFPRVAEVVSALQRGEADFTITNATTERAQLVDFAQPIVDLELGAMAMPGSRVTHAERLDVPGAVIGVGQGSTSERTLGSRFTQAKLRAFPSLDAARAALQAREIDAFATNKGVLYEQVPRMPGAFVIEGRWGVEHLAPAIPKGRATGLAYLQAFTRDVRDNGEFQRAADRAGLKGTAAPAP